MKKLKLFIVFLTICYNSFGQVQTDIKDGVTYIIPNIENLISLCNCTEDQFMNIMTKYHYSDNESDAQWIKCMASIDNYLVHAVTNFDYYYKGGVIISWHPKNEMYPKSSVSEILRRLRPHFMRNEDDTDFFAFNYKGNAYGVMMVNDGNFYIIRTSNLGNSDSRLSEL